MKLPIFLFFFLCSSTMFAQNLDKVFDTFKDRRVINSHSVETLQKRKLDIRIGHRFGDIGGDLGGWATFYGLENAEDVLIGAEYGVSDRLTLGLFRTKGSGPLKQLINSQIKYRILQQTMGDNGFPLSVTFLGLVTASTMQKNDNPEVLNHFSKMVHRMIIGGQLLIARKFSDRFSLQVIPGYLHRNVVPFRDKNDLFSLGFATRIQLTKVLGLLADVTIPFSDYRNENNYEIPLGFGLEIDTGGHIFQINLTNAGGMSEADYIPYTDSSWGEGGFRLGFTISRLFNL